MPSADFIHQRRKMFAKMVAKGMNRSTAYADLFEKEKITNVVHNSASQLMRHPTVKKFYELYTQEIDDQKASEKDTSEERIERAERIMWDVANNKQSKDVDRVNAAYKIMDRHGAFKHNVKAGNQTLNLTVIHAGEGGKEIGKDNGEVINTALRTIKNKFNSAIQLPVQTVPDPKLASVRLGSDKDSKDRPPEKRERPGLLEPDDSAGFD